MFAVDCEGSTAVSSVWVTPNHDKDTAIVLVTYRSGDSWGYIMPLAVALVGLGEKSVGRFVASFVKPNATFAHKHEAVGV
jgi:hypothetical protein